MKQKFINWLIKYDSVYNFAVKIIANVIVRSDDNLSPSYLLRKGWINENNYWFEPDVKDRDRITIRFNTGNNTYLVFHGIDSTFITHESSLAWFEMYYLLIHSDNGRYKLAGI